MGRHKIPDEQNVCKFKALGCTHPHFCSREGMRKSRHHAVCKFNPTNVAAAAIAARDVSAPIASAVPVVPSIAVVPTPAVHMIASGSVSSKITIMVDQVPDATPTTEVVSPIEGIEDSPFEMVRHHGGKIVGVQYKGNVEMHEGVVSKCSFRARHLKLKKKRRSKACLWCSWSKRRPSKRRSIWRRCGSNFILHNSMPAGNLPTTP